MSKSYPHHPSYTVHRFSDSLHQVLSDFYIKTSFQHSLYALALLKNAKLSHTQKNILLIFVDVFYLGLLQVILSPESRLHLHQPLQWYLIPFVTVVHGLNRLLMQHLMNQYSMKLTSFSYSFIIFSFIDYISFKLIGLLMRFILFLIKLSSLMQFAPYLHKNFLYINKKSIL